MVGSMDQEWDDGGDGNDDRRYDPDMCVQLRLFDWLSEDERAVVRALRAFWRTPEGQHQDPSFIVLWNGHTPLLPRYQEPLFSDREVVTIAMIAVDRAERYGFRMRGPDDWRTVITPLFV